MKTGTFISVLVLAVVLASCAPVDTPAPIAAVTPVIVSTSTPFLPTLPPTLPPTLTPVPMVTQPQVTPTAIYTPIQLSPEDDRAYQKALSDIPVYRQGTIQVSLQDQNGEPLSAYEVKYRQVSHDFLFGGIADCFQIGPLRDAGMNSMTAYMDWPWIEPEYGEYDLEFANYWLGVDELKTGGMRIRTNSFFGMGDDMPPFWRNVPYDEFLERVYEHVSATVKRFAPSVDNWEAFAEPNFGNHNPLNLTKSEYYEVMATAIRAIRDNDPTATVEISLSYPCGGLDWLDNFEIVREMLDRNIDFDAVGLQYYENAYIEQGPLPNYQFPRMSLSKLGACYDRYESMLTPHGKRILSSEGAVPSEVPAGQIGYWDIPWSEDTQAQYLATVWTIFFSKPSNMGLVWWDTIEPSLFVYHGGLIREDGTPKKSYHTLQRLIESWTTTGEGITDNGGAVTFKGFGGDYEVEITNPANGESMVAQVHVTEQESISQTIEFIPNSQLFEKRIDLEELVSYWESKPEQGFVQKGNDYLALVRHHIQNAEWGLAAQTLAAALDELAITTRIGIPNEQLVPAGSQGGGHTIEDGSNLIWGAVALHFPYAFPAGTVTVEVKAHSHNEKGESPLMVVGVGANYSQVWRVENEQSQVYTFTTATSGNERDLTIRFPYDGRVYERIIAQNGNIGALKLYVDEVQFVIRTSEVP